jgi:RNA polymerase sigma-70 factor (ECF subfamily)
VEGLEISEIAAITSISENAISVNLSRARQKLRTELMEKSKKEKI